MARRFESAAAWALALTLLGGACGPDTGDACRCPSDCSDGLICLADQVITACLDPSAAGGVCAEREDDMIGGESGTQGAIASELIDEWLAGQTSSDAGSESGSDASTGPESSSDSGSSTSSETTGSTMDSSGDEASTGSSVTGTESTDSGSESTAGTGSEDDSQGTSGDSADSTDSETDTETTGA